MESVLGTSKDESDYKAMLRNEEYYAKAGGFEGAMDRHNCDVLIVPAGSMAPQTFLRSAEIRSSLFLWVLPLTEPRSGTMKTWWSSFGSPGNPVSALLPPPSRYHCAQARLTYR